MRCHPGSIILILLLLAAVPPALALDGWSQVRPVTVTNAGDALADYQVKIILDDAGFDFGRAAPGGADLRVTAEDGQTVLPHWVETWDAAAGRAVVWTRVDILPAGGTRRLYLHADNPAATDTGDGAATFLFYSGFEELAAATGLNAAAPLVTPTYDGSGQVVHPDVVHVPGGWNGYEYWMGMTPYPNSNDDWENPSLLVSNDNTTWTVPPGVTNPLAPEPDGHNDDVDMLLVGGEMVMYWVETNNDGFSYITRLASTDGVDWGQPQVVLTIPNYVMSPAIVHEDGTWTMWYVRSPAGCTSSYQDVARRTSTDGIVWGPEQPVTLEQPGRVPWHLDVQVTATGYAMLFISYPDGSSCGDTRLYHAASGDGLAWDVGPAAILAPTSSGWDNANIYRASFTQDGTWLRIWYSARSTSGRWRVGYTEGDLADFPVAPVETWSELHGGVAATTDQPRTGTHALRETGGSTYPQVFAAVPGTDVCVNVWYREELSTTADFMALIRLWDADTSVWSHHCIGTGVWTGASTTAYSYHTEGFAYTPTTVAREPGWRLLSIAAVGSACELRIDDVPVATLAVLDPALVDRFSVEGYRGGVGYFDDAYVRRCAAVEPVAAVGAEIVAGADLPAAGPTAALEQNVPNPLNPGTTIAFRLPAAGPVRLTIADARGRTVRTLVDGTRAAGRHEVRWDGRDDRGGRVASGTYLYRLDTPAGTVGRKLSLVK